MATCHQLRGVGSQVSLVFPLTKSHVLSDPCVEGDNDDSHHLLSSYSFFLKKKYCIYGFVWLCQVLVASRGIFSRST